CRRWGTTPGRAAQFPDASGRCTRLASRLLALPVQAPSRIAGKLPVLSPAPPDTSGTHSRSLPELQDDVQPKHLLRPASRLTSQARTNAKPVSASASVEHHPEAPAKTDY